MLFPPQRPLLNHTAPSSSPRSFNFSCSSFSNDLGEIWARCGKYAMAGGRKRPRQRPTTNINQGESGVSHPGVYFFLPCCRWKPASLTQRQLCNRRSHLPLLPCKRSPPFQNTHHNRWYDQRRYIREYPTRRRLRNSVLSGCRRETDHFFGCRGGIRWRSM